jgi:hypothetical protein
MRRLDQDDFEDPISHSVPNRARARAHDTFDKQCHTKATGANTQAFQWGGAARPKKDTVSSTQIHTGAKQDSQPQRIKRGPQAKHCPHFQRPKTIQQERLDG